MFSIPRICSDMWELGPGDIARFPHSRDNASMDRYHLQSRVSQDDNSLELSWICCKCSLIMAAEPCRCIRHDPGLCPSVMISAVQSVSVVAMMASLASGLGCARTALSCCKLTHLRKSAWAWLCSSPNERQCVAANPSTAASKCDVLSAMGMRTEQKSRCIISWQERERVVQEVKWCRRLRWLRESQPSS